VSVRLSVREITQKVMNGFLLNRLQGWGVHGPRNNQLDIGSDPDNDPDQTQQEFLTGFFIYSCA